MGAPPDPTVVIANPAAAGGRVHRRWSQIERALRDALGPVTILRTARRGHATELAREAAASGRVRILSLGGDGTHGEVVAGLVRDGPAPDTITLGILPVGSGGDFRRALEGSGHLADHVRRIPTADAHRIDVGVIRCLGPAGSPVVRTFLNEASFGTSGLVCAGVNRSSKPFGGRATYLLETLRAMTRYVPVPVRIWLDGADTGVHHPTTVVLGNGRYAGAGMRFTPQARLADGRLDLTVVRRAGIARSLRLAPHLYAGTLPRSGLSVHLRGHAVRAEALDAPAPWVEADGEPLGTLPAEAWVIPSAVRVLGLRREVL